MKGRVHLPVGHRRHPVNRGGASRNNIGEIAASFSIAHRGLDDGFDFLGCGVTTSSAEMRNRGDKYSGLEQEHQASFEQKNEVAAVTPPHADEGNRSSMVEDGQTGYSWAKWVRASNVSCCPKCVWRLDI